jgi:hypothetical protein
MTLATLQYVSERQHDMYSISVVGPLYDGRGYNARVIERPGRDASLADSWPFHENAMTHLHPSSYHEQVMKLSISMSTAGEVVEDFEFEL